MKIFFTPDKIKKNDHLVFTPVIPLFHRSKQLNNQIKFWIMIPQKLLMKWMLLFLMLCGMNALAQGPYPKTGDQSVCLDATEPYGVILNAGSTYAWSITSLTGGNGTLTAGATPNLVTVHWTSAGRATLSVVETNAQGCTGDPVTILVTVNALPKVTVNSSTICAGTTASIIATPDIAGNYNYVWTVPSGVTNPGNVSNFTSTAAGSYSVVITSTTTGCSSASSSGTVSINAAPSLVIHDPSASCDLGTADLTAASVTAGSTAGLNFSYWTDAAATIPYATPATAPAGTYYIKGSLGAGCFDIKPVTVTASQKPVVVVHDPVPVCAPATVDLTAASVTAGSTAGLSFTYWKDAAATIPLTTPAIATAGTYFIKGSFGAGCFDIKAVVVSVNPLPSPLITGPGQICESTGGSTVGYSTTAVAGHVYNWQVTGGTIASGQNTNQVSVVWTIPGTATIRVSDTITNSGCSATDVKTVIVSAKPVTSAITHN
ncbi:MAG: hypothetical protein ACJ75B_02685 [Flavisolibacter sp.]